MFAVAFHSLLQKDTKRAVTPYKPPDPVSQNTLSDDGSHGALFTPKERGMLSYGNIFLIFVYPCLRSKRALTVNLLKNRTVFIALKGASSLLQANFFFKLCDS